MKFCAKRNLSCMFYEDKQTYCDEYPRYCCSTCYSQDGKYLNYSRENMGVIRHERLYQEIFDNRYWKDAADFYPKLDITCFVSYDGGNKKSCDDSSRLKLIPFTNMEHNPNFCISFDSASEKPDFEDQIYPNSLNIEFLIGTRPETYFHKNDPVVVYAAVHNRMQLVNPFIEGYALEAGKNYKADVSLSEVVRIKPPYSTRCFDYITAWKVNNGTGPLTQYECIEHCKLTTVTSLNKCVGPSVNYPHFGKLCINGETATHDIIKSCTQKCDLACVEQKYSVEYREQASMREEYNYHSCNRIDEMNEKEKEPYAHGSKEHCQLKEIKVAFSFGKFRLRRQIYSEQYQSVELFSYIGGYLGLWLGLGLITFFESVGDIACYFWRKKAFQNFIRSKSSVG